MDVFKLPGNGLCSGNHTIHLGKDEQAKGQPCQLRIVGL